MAVAAASSLSLCALHQNGMDGERQMRPGAVGSSGMGRYNGHANCVCDSRRKLRDLER